ncbi:SHOCT domain-containing protein [Halorussus marinus]|uniref:SHOCT domain-containing protein n=1 Tax=Halorussus marinus TaxID=2505976 RepID=UPI00106EC034|nr:SHOCT domain-containing protein [Halorussus marinus]
MVDSLSSTGVESDESGDNTATQVASLLVVGLGLLGLFAGIEGFWLVFVIGFAVVVPLVDTLLGDDEASADPDASVEAPESKQEALDTLRDRYARGDLSDAEFERKVERLLETETPESARDHVARERGGERVRERE